MTPALTKKQTKTLWRILIAFALLLCVLAYQQTQPPAVLTLTLYLIPYALVGYDVLLRAAKNILHGKIFDENFLMTIATIGALCLGEYPEAVAVMLFYQTGELFQNYAVTKSRKSIAALMDIRPDHAAIERNGQLIEVNPEELSAGDEIIIKPGDRVPLDGIILTGTSELDTASLTGESLPKPVTEGDKIISGCINLSGLLRVRVTAPYSQSTVAKILDLVENAATKKAKTENFITTFARYYTPAVVLVAAALAILPPLLLGEPLTDWISRALIFLVVSCPCALVISIPLSFYGGIGGASRNGILIKGGNYLETLARTGTVVFDKTGTLTTGTFRLTEICPADGITPDQLLAWAAAAETASTHPLARSILEACKQPVDQTAVTHITEEAGLGVSAQVHNTHVLPETHSTSSVPESPYPKTCPAAPSSISPQTDATQATSGSPTPSNRTQKTQSPPSNSSASATSHYSPATQPQPPQKPPKNSASPPTVQNSFRRTNSQASKTSSPKTPDPAQPSTSATASTTPPYSPVQTQESPWEASDPTPQSKPQTSS